MKTRKYRIKRITFASGIYQFQIEKQVYFYILFIRFSYWETVQKRIGEYPCTDYVPLSFAMEETAKQHIQSLQTEEISNTVIKTEILETYQREKPL